MIYVMSDIHGRLERFNSVLSQINLQPDDTLYILGDVIDRGNDGIRILRRIMTMPNVKMLLGNHEYMMINAIARDANDPWTFEDEERSLSIWYNNGGRVTHRHLKHLRKTTRDEIFSFIRSLPLEYDVKVNGEQFKLVHSTAPESCFRQDDPIQIRHDAVWYRQQTGFRDPEDYTLIFGHTPTWQYQDDNPISIWKSAGGRRIGIDCGAAYVEPLYDRYFELLIQTRLACLRLDDMKVFYSTDGGNDETNDDSAESR